MGRGWGKERCNLSSYSYITWHTRVSETVKGAYGWKAPEDKIWSADVEFCSFAARSVNWELGVYTLPDQCPPHHRRLLHPFSLPQAAELLVSWLGFHFRSSRPVEGCCFAAPRRGTGCLPTLPGCSVVDRCISKTVQGCCPAYGSSAAWRCWEAVVLNYADAARESFEGAHSSMPLM